MKHIFGLALTLSLTVFISSSAWGAAAGFGARAIGMGGAYTALANDESAAYWNPAGITDTEHFRSTLGVGYHGDFTKLSNAASKISNNEMPAREDLNGDYSLMLLLGLNSKNAGMNFYSDTLINTSEDDTQTIQANLKSTNYGVLTFAGRFGDDEEYAIGVNIKAVGYGEGAVNIPPLPTVADPNNPTPAEVTAALAYQATTSYSFISGAACDLGFMYALDDNLRIAFTARNFFTRLNSGTTKTTTQTFSYDGSKVVMNESTVSTPYSTTLPKSYVFGVAYAPFEHTLLAADLENISDSANDQTRLHLGVEQNALWNLISLRLGYFSYKDDITFKDCSGYTAGLGFNLFIVNCNVACIQTDDREYVATFNLSF